MQDIGWLLTLEPIGDTLAWSLLRADDAGTELVGAALIADSPKLRAAAVALRPDINAGPNSDGHAGVWTSALCDPEREERAAITLGLGLLPRILRESLGTTARAAHPTPGNPPSAAGASGDRPSHTVTIATRGWPAMVPWDLLSLTPDGSVRLLERAVVLGGLSAALAVGRWRVAPRQDPRSAGLAVIDPGPVRGPMLRLYPNGYPDLLTGSDGLDPDDVCTAETRGTTVEEFAYLLHQRPARLLYVGHIHPAPEDAPAAAALVLSEAGGRKLLTARAWLAQPQTWPSPRRVAFVGCASNDTTTFEQSGLVVAAVNAGAQLVTSTRWPLPVDHVAPAALIPANPVHHQGLTKLAVAVHRAHLSADPVAVLRRWQLTQLKRWRVTHLLEHAPLTWASLVSYLAPEPAQKLASAAEGGRSGEEERT